MGVWKESRINNLRIPSRFVCSATSEGFCTEDGEPTPRLVERYRELGVDGCIGLITTGHAYVARAGKMRAGQIGIDGDARILGLEQVARAAKADGSRLFLQLAHGGVMCSRETTGTAPVGPSPCPDWPEALAMTLEEVRSLPALFASAAQRAQEAGFDGVQLHAAHGYLLSQFLSPYYNRREDEYGGSQENRTRVVMEIIKAIHLVCGGAFPVGAKVNASDFIEVGLSLEDALLSVRLMERAGLDYVEVSGGICTNPDPAKGPMRHVKGEECYFADNARFIKEGVEIPVVMVGGIRTLETAEQIVVSGDADFVALCRPLIREPHLIRRWKKGDREPSACCSCNGCLVAMREKGGLVCVANP